MGGPDDGDLLPAAAGPAGSQETQPLVEHGHHVRGLHEEPIPDGADRIYAPARPMDIGSAGPHHATTPGRWERVAIHLAPAASAEMR